MVNISTMNVTAYFKLCNVFRFLQTMLCSIVHSTCDIFSCWSHKLLVWNHIKFFYNFSGQASDNMRSTECKRQGIFHSQWPAQCCWHTSDFLKPFNELYYMFCWWNWKYICVSDHLKLYALFWYLPYEQLPMIKDFSNTYILHLQLLDLTVNTYGQTDKKFCLTHSKTEFLCISFKLLYTVPYHYKSFLILIPIVNISSWLLNSNQFRVHIHLSNGLIDLSAYIEDPGFGLLVIHFCKVVNHFPL
jgi:hypothetical protein